MLDNIVNDVRIALYTQAVRGIVLYHSNHLKLLTTYGAIADAIKATPSGGQINQTLARIAEEDFEAKGPLTTAVVVNATTSRPGKGFFAQARHLGIEITQDEAAEDAFWHDQLRKLGVAPFTLEGFITKMAEEPQSTNENPKVVGGLYTKLRSTTILTGETVFDENDLKDKIAANLKGNSPLPEYDKIYLPAGRLIPGDIVLWTDAHNPGIACRKQSYVARELKVSSVRHEGATTIWTSGAETFTIPSYGTHLKIRPRPSKMYINVPIAAKKPEEPVEPASQLPRGD
jgi:hypothetical protein